MTTINYTSIECIWVWLDHDLWAGLFNMGIPHIKLKA